MIARWYQERGRHLQWEHLFILQWDMLVLAPLSLLLEEYKPDQLLISGLRPLTEVQSWWGWVNGADREKKRDFDEFTVLLRNRYGYQGESYCGLFIVVRLPRCFMDLYIETGPPETGFIEYKIPSFAAALAFLWLSVSLSNQSGTVSRRSVTNGMDSSSL